MKRCDFIKALKNKNILLIIFIYLAFITLGLPDGLLGVAWPKIRLELDIPLENMGFITSTLFILSAISSFLSSKLIMRLGTGILAFLSGIITGLALFAYSISQSFVWLILCTIPLGFGQGAVDSALNLYVAENYSAKHMNWLHCFWGLGASIGPLIMTFAITNLNSWHIGYKLVAILQIMITITLVYSIVTKLWLGSSFKDMATEENYQEQTALSDNISQIMAVVLFFLYSGIESTIGIWLITVLVESREIEINIAGTSISMYYSSIMLGRFMTGVIISKIGNIKMIRIGLITTMLGSIILLISYSSIGIFVGVILMGLGLAPIYPCLMHETPRRFTKEISKKLVGYQVGTACLGSSLISISIGFILSNISMELLVPIVIVFQAIFLLINEILQKKVVSLRE